MEDMPSEHHKNENSTLCSDREDLANGNEAPSSRTKHAVRLLTFIPGSTLYQIRPWTAKHFNQCGKLLANLTLAIKVITICLSISCLQYVLSSNWLCFE